MGSPHTATENLEYNNMHITKGAHILPAVWWFLHDPETYDNPESFIPYRFLPPRSEPDPATEAFGYGRRSCPGRSLAESSLYLNIVQSLAAFNIRKVVGKDGKIIEIDVKPRAGIPAYPTKFGLQVEPRSAMHIDIVRSGEQQVMLGFSISNDDTMMWGFASVHRYCLRVQRSVRRLLEENLYQAFTVPR